MSTKFNSDIKKTIDWHLDRSSSTPKIIESVKRKHNQQLESVVSYYFVFKFIFSIPVR